MIKLFKETQEEYRIKVVTLNSNENLYYPQYKEKGFTSRFQTLMVVNIKNIITSNQLTNTSDYSCDNENLAKTIISSHKLLLQDQKKELIKESKIITL